MTSRVWVKASRSHGNGNCVEVRPVDGGVEVRDSKDPDGPVLRFTAAEFDRVANLLLVGTVDWDVFAPLVFTPAEREAFLDGVGKGEFDHLTEGKPVSTETDQGTVDAVREALLALGWRAWGGYDIYAAPGDEQADGVTVELLDEEVMPAEYAISVFLPGSDCPCVRVAGSVPAEVAVETVRAAIGLPVNQVHSSGAIQTPDPGDDAAVAGLCHAAGLAPLQYSVAVTAVLTELRERAEARQTEGGSERD